MKKLIILWSGIFVVMTMCLIPPWVQYETISEKPDETGQVRHHRYASNLGYHFILEPPIGGGLWNLKLVDYNDTNLDKNFVEKYNRERLMEEFRTSYDIVKIDITRLIIQCLIVCLIIGGLLYTLKDRKNETGGK